MDIPSLFMIPSAVSSGKVHSVFPNSTDADFDFNRDSDATRVNSEGLIERVGYYGAEKLTNNDFTNGLVGYSGTTNYSVVNNQLVANSSGLIYQGSILTNSTFYKFTIDIESVTSGGIKAYANGNQSAAITTAGIHTLIIQAGTSQVYAGLNPQGTFIGVINSISFKEVTGDRARLNYEIEGGLVNTKPSLLLEPQSTNLATYSQDFSQWSTISASATDDYATSPEGITNASRFLTTSTGAYLYLSSISVSNSTVYTISVYAKSNGNNLDDFRIYTSLGDSSTLTATSEWQRFTYTFTTSVTSINIGFRPSSTQNADIQVFGYQLEQQSYPTSYIPTNGSTQTRAAETCNGAGTSSIFESSEGILYTEISVNGLPSSGFLILGLNDGTVNNNVFIEIGTNGLLTFFVISGGTNVASKVSSVNPLNNFVKCAIRYKLNDVSFWINGTEIHSDTSATMPVGLSQLDFDYGNGAHKFYGNVRDIRVYNTKEMTDSEVDILLTKITS